MAQKLDDGIEIGIEMGIDIGEKKATVNMVLKLLAKNRPIAEISEVTGLSVGQIEEISNQENRLTLVNAS